MNNNMSKDGITNEYPKEIWHSFSQG